MLSLVERIRQKATSPLLTHGMGPSQYSALALLGVAPTWTSNSSPMDDQHHPSGSLATLDRSGFADCLSPALVACLSLRSPRTRFTSIVAGSYSRPSARASAASVGA